MTGLPLLSSTLLLLAAPAAFQASVGEPAASANAAIVWTIAGILFAVAATCWLLWRRARADATDSERRLVLQSTSFEKAKDKIRDFTDAQGRFVGNLARELKDPLATVLIHADLLLAGTNEPAVVQRYAKGIAEDTRHLSDLIESFLRLARPFAQDDTRSHVPVHFHDVVTEAVRRCQSLAVSCEVTVVPTLAEPDGDAPVEVLGDAVLLEAMIENLVRNAVIAAPRKSRVDLQVKLQGEEVVLSVRDLGTKFEEGKIDTLFDGFFQVPGPPRTQAGTGLSLAIAKRVVEHHHGSLSLRNVPEGGCEFEVQLPRWRTDAPPGPPTRLRAVPQG